MEMEMEMEWVGRYTNFLTLGILSYSTIITDYINIRFYFQSNEKPSQRWLDHELEVMVNVHQVRHEYDKQSQVYAMLTFFLMTWVFGYSYLAQAHLLSVLDIQIRLFC